MCLAAQPLPELLERIAGCGRRYLGVDLHRDGDLGVPQNLHRNARMYVEGGEARNVPLHDRDRRARVARSGVLRRGQDAVAQRVAPP